MVRETNKEQTRLNAKMTVVLTRVKVKQCPIDFEHIYNSIEDWFDVLLRYDDNCDWRKGSEGGSHAITFHFDIFPHNSFFRESFFSRPITTPHKNNFDFLNNHLQYVLTIREITSYY